MTSQPREEEIPLAAPPPLPRRRSADLLAGIQLVPVRRLRAFPPDDLENVVRHWLHEGIRGKYHRLIRFGGPGDKGRDVAGYTSAEPGCEWDNYQCKQYDKKLTPALIWPELGKLVYWVTEGSYTVPRNYLFVAPLGISNPTRELLDDHDRLRAGLAKNWGTSCANLCPYTEIEQVLQSFAFAFDVATAEDIVDGLEGTAIYPVFFGGGLSKPRPVDTPPPSEVAAHELTYITRLVEAYDDHCPHGVSDLDAASAHEEYGPHLRDSRRDFYCAESLREFSKDVLVEPDDFESLQEQVYDGVKYTILREFSTGYDRVLAVCEHATEFAPESPSSTVQVNLEGPAQAGSWGA
jgi:hypothetical protein